MSLILSVGLRVPTKTTQEQAGEVLGLISSVSLRVPTAKEQAGEVSALYFASLIESTNKNSTGAGRGGEWALFSQ